MENKKKLQKKINSILFILHFIPYALYIIYQLFWINYIFVFQTGLLIIYGLLTGLYFNVVLGFNYQDFTNKKDIVDEHIKRIRQIKSNMITITFIGIIFYAICLFNLSNIIIAGCPSINSPDGIKNIELLDIDKGYSLNDIEEDNHDIKRALQFLPNNDVNNFISSRLCHNEIVLFYLLFFFLIYILILNIITFYSYSYKITNWDDSKSTKYHHFVFTLLHFIPFLIVLAFNIIFVYRVTMIYNGLLIPFGFTTGILISVLRTQQGSLFKYDSKISRKFLLTSANRFYICISSLISILFVIIYIGKMSYSLSLCVSNIPYTTDVTNKAYTDFLITELCNNEYIQSIILICFISYNIVLALITLILYLFYFKNVIKDE